MNEEYQKGKEVGEMASDIKNIKQLLEDHIEKQDKWNDAIEKRVSLAEKWIQTTTGKVIILTTIFSVAGSLAYILINWLIYRFSK